MTNVNKKFKNKLKIIYYLNNTKIKVDSTVGIIEIKFGKIITTLIINNRVAEIFPFIPAVMSTQKQ